MKKSSLYSRVLNRKGPIATRTRSKMGSPLRKTNLSQYPFEWWKKKLKMSKDIDVHKSTSGASKKFSVSTDKLDERDGEKVKNSKGTAKRSSALKETLAKSHRSRRQNAKSTKRITRSLIKLVSFIPRRRSREKQDGVSSASKFMRSKALSRARRARSRKIRIIRRARSSRRKRRSIKSRRRRSTLRRRRSMRREAHRSRAKSRRRTYARRRRGKSRMRASRRRKGRKSTRSKKRRYRRGSSCTDTESPRRKRVLYPVDFFNKEQTQVLNEPHQVNYDNSDKGHDELNEDPLNNVCRNLVKSLDGTPADDRTDNKKKPEEKPELQKDGGDSKRHRKKKKPRRHLGRHVRRGCKRCVVYSKNRRRRHGRKRLKRKAPNRRPANGRYPGYGIMDDGKRKMGRYIKKVHRVHTLGRRTAHQSLKIHATLKLRARPALRKKSHALHQKRRREQQHRHHRQKTNGRRLTSRNNTSCIPDSRQRRRLRHTTGSKHLRKPQDRNNNNRHDYQVKWLRWLGRLHRVKDMGRELLKIACMSTCSNPISKAPVCLKDKSTYNALSYCNLVKSKSNNCKKPGVPVSVSSASFATTGSNRHTGIKMHALGDDASSRTRCRHRYTDMIIRHGSYLRAYNAGRPRTRFEQSVLKNKRDCQ